MRHLATGYYAYQTIEDGLCEFKTKRTAIRHAEEAARRIRAADVDALTDPEYLWDRVAESMADPYRVRVYSPAGRLVHVA